MAFGSANTPGAWFLKVKNQLREILARIGSVEKTLTGLTAADVGAAPATRKINNKALNADITLTAADVGASSTGHRHTRSEITDFPASMPASDVAAWAKAAQKPGYTASEVGAAAEGHGHDAAEIGLPAAAAAALGLPGNATVAEALAAAVSAMVGNVRIAAGSYTGTGTYGQSAHNSLSFGFEPDVVFVFKDRYVPVATSNNYTAFSDSYVCFLRGGQTVVVRDLYQPLYVGSNRPDPVATIEYMPYTMSGTELSWYYSGSNVEDIGPSSQMNSSNTVYHYLAIGREAAE